MRSLDSVLYRHVKYSCTHVFGQVFVFSTFLGRSDERAASVSIHQLLVGIGEAATLQKARVSPVGIQDPTLFAFS